MAEFCLECFNEHVLPHLSRRRRRKDVTLSDELWLCEGCGEYKRVVLLDQPEPFWRRWLHKKKG